MIRGLTHAALLGHGPDVVRNVLSQGQEQVGAVGLRRDLASLIVDS